MDRYSYKGHIFLLFLIMQCMRIGVLSASETISLYEFASAHTMIGCQLKWMEHGKVSQVSYLSEIDTTQQRWVDQNQQCKQLFQAAQEAGNRVDLREVVLEIGKWNGQRYTEVVALTINNPLSVLNDEDTVAKVKDTNVLGPTKMIYKKAEIKLFDNTIYVLVEML
ncbi:MAG: hypothetical protein KDK51_02340 [Deltaproteobacteria bacterium]|nr:hypothetical protein [Deltaproteobacteria bacterium]